jgi:hypothetical protein
MIDASVCWAVAVLFVAGCSGGHGRAMSAADRGGSSLPSSSLPLTTPGGARNNVVGPATSPASARAVKGVIVEQALFGSGTSLADVTDRVVQLLLSEPQGFTAQSDWLRVDPAPGKNKSLVIRYVYHDAVRMFVVTGYNRASYAAMTADPAKR